MVMTLLLLAAAQDVGTWIEDLGRDDVTAKGEAWKALDAAGEAALPALRKALYHENPEIRVQAKEILKSIQKRMAVAPAVEQVRKAVAKLRARWAARDFDDLEIAAREAFAPRALQHVQYVPKKEIGPRLESESGGPPGGGFRPLQTGGARDVLTREIADALDGRDGLVFLDASRRVTELSDVLLATLPDRDGKWSAYVVLRVAPIPSSPVPATSYRGDAFKSRLLASTDNRAVWGVDMAELDWVQANLEEVLTRHVTLVPAPAAGLRVASLLQGGVPHARGVLEGDVVRELNGQPVSTVAELRLALQKLGDAQGLRIAVERDGKPVVLEYRPLPR